MKITQVLTMDRGGAARAALRLQEGLEGRGLDSKVLVARKRSRLESVYEWEGPMDARSRLARRSREEWLSRTMRRRLGGRRPGLGFFSDDRSRFGGQLLPDLEEADLIHLHWIARFVDFPAVFSKLKRPVVWTLHDQFPLTGGCHVDEGCDRWRVGCGECPQISISHRDDFSAKSWRRKKKSIENFQGKLVPVAPSGLFLEMAKKSPLFEGLPIKMIPHGLPINIYKPTKSGSLKVSFGVEKDGYLILFVADKVSDPNKGFRLLVEALEGFSRSFREKITLLSVGKNSPTKRLGVKHIGLGEIKNENLLAAIYSSSDVFVASSFRESFGNTVLESLACGTPVVGSNTGGIPEMVRPGETGWLFETGNPEALRATLQEALATRDLTGLRTRCREVAEREYSLELQAERYSKLYLELLRQGRESTT